MTRFFEESFFEAIVDKEKLEIKNISVLGNKSRNGYEYSRKAMDSLARLIDSQASYTNHDKERKRNVKDLLGAFSNGRSEGTRVRADLRLLEKEKWLLEVAEKMPKTIGFSVDVDGDLSKDKKIVEDITKINSIDLVDRPATVKGLFEEENGVDLKEMEEKIKLLEAENSKIRAEMETEKSRNAKLLEEEKAKMAEEKRLLEAEKKRISLREQCEKELPKTCVTPEFLAILEEVKDPAKAIADRKNLLEEARKGMNFSKDNTFAMGAKEPSRDELKKAFKKE